MRPGFNAAIRQLIPGGAKVLDATTEIDLELKKGSKGRKHYLTALDSLQDAREALQQIVRDQFNFPPPDAKE